MPILKIGKMMLRVQGSGYWIHSVVVLGLPLQESGYRVTFYLLTQHLLKALLLITRCLSQGIKYYASLVVNKIY